MGVLMCVMFCVTLQCVLKLTNCFEHLKGSFLLEFLKECENIEQ